MSRAFQEERAARAKAREEGGRSALWELPAVTMACEYVCEKEEMWLRLWVGPDHTRYWGLECLAEGRGLCPVSRRGRASFGCRKTSLGPHRGGLEGQTGGQ